MLTKSVRRARNDNRSLKSSEGVVWVCMRNAGELYTTRHAPSPNCLCLCLDLGVILKN